LGVVATSTLIINVDIDSVDIREARAPHFGQSDWERVVTDANGSAEQNKAIVKEFLEVFSTGDVPGIVELLHEDATWWVSGKIEGFAGTKTREEMGALLEGVVTSYKGGALRLTPKTMVAEGNHVAVEAAGYAELTNGRVYNPDSAFVFEIADGKIKQVKEYLDTQHAYEIFFVG
jgi:ketosteroid isomerase-like protein